MNPAFPAPVPVLGLAAPFSPDTLTPAALALLQSARLVCGGRRLLDAVAPLVPQARLLPLAAPLETSLARLDEARAREPGALVVLADGDPLFFGIGATLVRRWGADAVRIHPAPSCLQLACARLGLPWQDVATVSLHGREALHPFLAAALRRRPFGVLTDARTTPALLARVLLDRGLSHFRVHVFEDLGFPHERRWQGSLTEASCRYFGPACTLLLLPDAAPRRPHLGLSAAALVSDRGLMTKQPVRAAALSLLRLAPDDIFWDIGAGSGALSIEAASLLPEGRVYAVERTPRRALDIQENRQRCGAANLHVTLGTAPAALASLPAPHAVFVGGGLSGGAAAPLLSALYARLLPGGRLVAACVLLDSLAACRQALRTLTTTPPILLQIAAAEARPLGADCHLAALNPVFLVMIEKEAPRPPAAETSQALPYRIHRHKEEHA